MSEVAEVKQQKQFSHLRIATGVVLTMKTLSNYYKDSSVMPLLIATAKMSLFDDLSWLTASMFT